MELNNDEYQYDNDFYRHSHYHFYHNYDTLFNDNNHNVEINNVEINEPYNPLDIIQQGSEGRIHIVINADEIQECTFSDIENPISLICPITFMEFSPNSNVSMITHCNHIFDPDSLKVWLSTHKNCPVCRYNLKTTQSFTPQNESIVSSSSHPPRLRRREFRHIFNMD
jgi:hypothetical protein